MRAGIITTLRVNPRDAQSILDVLDAVGLPRAALSFAQCTSLALGALLETARQNRLIPEPDEFEYLNRLGPYLATANQPKKRIAKALHNMGGSLRAPVVRPGREERSAEVTPMQTGAREARPPVGLDEPEDSPELLAAKKELTKLLVEKEIGEDAETWSDAQEEHYRKVYNIVYPNG